MSYSVQFGFMSSLFKMLKGLRMEQDLTQLAAKYDSTGYDEVDNYFATGADTLINNYFVYEHDLDED